MNSYIYIDYQNRGDLKNLPKVKNGRYFVFLGFHQTDDIKCEQGMRIKKIKMDKEGKDYLDCHLIDSITKRKNLPNTTHYIVSHDKGFEPWVNYLNSKAKKVIAKRIDKIDL